MKKVFFFLLLLGMAGLGFVFSKNYNHYLDAEAKTTEVHSSKSTLLLGSATDQQGLIDQLTELSISIKTREDVIAVAELVKKVADEPKNRNYPAVQLYGSFAQVVPLLEGIVYRCRNIFRLAP